MTRIVLYLIVFIAIALVTGGAFNGLLRLLHHRPHTHPVLIMTLGEGISAVSAVLAFWIMVRFVDKQPWATAGFNRSGMAAARSAPKRASSFLLSALSPEFCCSGPPSKGASGCRGRARRLNDAKEIIFSLRYDCGSYQV